MELNFKCEYCGKKFAKEKTLAVHVCEQKRRHLGKNEKHVQAALLTYNRFYELAQGGKGNKTFAEFAKSPYYNAFVKFGSFIANTNPIYPERFIDYVVKSGVKLDHWARDAVYDQYLLDLIKAEPAESAIQRSIKTMMEWSDANDAPWEHYFKYVNLNRATHDIREGLISPWLLLNTKAGKEMLQGMNDEQLEIIGLIVDPQYWSRRLELIKEVIKEGKIL
jgi:hypothetical protein